MAVRDRDVVSIDGWAEGVNTISPETSLAKDQLRAGSNIDIDRDGGIRRRAGRTLLVAGSNIHSVYSDGRRVFFCDDGTLKQLRQDHSVAPLQSGLHTHSYLSYDQINADVYWSNGVQSGRIDALGLARPWGVEFPAHAPIALPYPNGGMAAGEYQVSIVYVGAKLELSGATDPVYVTVAEGGGISLVNIPQPTSPEVAAIRIYVSDTNCEILYRHSDIPYDAGSALVVSTVKGEALETLYLRPLPAAHIVRYFHGRALVAVGEQLVFSQPLRYGLHHPAQDFVLFPSRITVVQPVEGGVYVCADQTYFLAGTNPQEWEPVVVRQEQAVEGSGLSVDPFAFLELQQQVPGKVAYWFSESGGVVGLPGGRVLPVMDDRVAIPQYRQGASLFREQNGIRQIVTALSRQDDVTGFVATDTAIAEVRRNGIVLN